ncbi:MAG: hypothetical protein K2P77_08125 [Burkholderiaceae bacterium]|nr:hypothetical protein [Burkholderiaceae bacterium]
MVRRHFLHVLLSLLLVFSQQMGYSHALTHAASVAGVVNVLELADASALEHAEDAGQSGITKLGFDHSCAQCLAFAQLAAAADTRFHSFPLRDARAVVSPVQPAAPAGVAICCGYHSRAPPVLS